MGEGAGVVVLEEYEHAKARGAQDLCRGDRLRPVGRRLPHHRAAAGRRRRLPLHDGGAQARRASRPPRSTTSTRTAPRRRSATRSSSARCERAGRQRGRQASRCRRPNPAIGHLLGAAGAVEAIFSILAIRDRVAPPTLNLDNPSVETPIDLVPHKAREARHRRRAVEFVRLRRHQRVAGFPPRAAA